MPAGRSTAAKTRRAAASVRAKPARRAKPAKSAAPAGSAKSGAKPLQAAAAAKPPKTAKAVKPAKTAKAAKPAKADKAARAPKPPKQRVVLVRDSFTMPETDFALVATLKSRALAARREAKKSELLRAGLHALAALDGAALVAALERLQPVKTGRPKKSH